MFSRNRWVVLNLSEYTCGVLFLRENFDAVFESAQNGTLDCNMNHLNDKWSLYCVDEDLVNYFPPEPLAEVPLLIFINFEDHYWGYRIVHRGVELSAYFTGEDASPSMVQRFSDVTRFRLFDLEDDAYSNLQWLFAPLYLKSRGRFQQVDWFKSILGIEEMTWLDYDRCYDVRDAEDSKKTDIIFFTQNHMHNIVFQSDDRSNLRSMYQRAINGYYDESGLRRFSHDGKYGFMDEIGNVFIEPQFERTYSFSSGLAPIMSNHHFGFINVYGDVVVQPEYTHVGQFVDNRVVAHDGKTYVILNSDGEVVHRFDDARVVFMTFEEGLVPFSSEDELWGFVNSDGEVVIAPQFELAQPFLNGFARVRARGEWFYIRSDGSRFTHEGNYELDDFSEGFFIGRTPGSRGTAILDVHGNVICDVSYPIFGGFSEGLAVAAMPRTFGRRFYMNPYGEVVIDGYYRSAEPFVNGLARVSVEHEGRTKFTFIDRRGMPTFRPQRFIYVGDVHYPSNLFEVQKRDWTYIHRKSGLEIRPKWPMIGT